jgi:nitroreductase
LPEAQYGAQYFAQMDLGQAVAYLTLSAADIGLGTCIIGMFPNQTVKQLIHAPENSIVRLIIAVGYPADTRSSRPKTRKPLFSIVSYNHR